VLATPLFYFNRQIMLGRVAALRLPAMYQWPEMAEEGGFAGYGPRLTQWYRQLARLLAQVLRSAHPGDLPIEQPTRFELVLNLQPAKTIGREIPTELVARAFGTKRTSRRAQSMSAFGGKADIGLTPRNVRF